MNSRAEEIRSLLQASPFRRFTIKVADGRQFEVRRRSEASVTLNGSAILLSSTDDCGSSLPTDQVLDIIVEPSPSPQVVENVERIRKFRAALPFAPFTIVVNDGRELLVDLPYRIAISPGGREICFAAPPLGYEFIPAMNLKEVINGGG